MDNFIPKLSLFVDQPLTLQPRPPACLLKGLLLNGHQRPTASAEERGGPGHGGWTCCALIVASRLLGASCVYQMLLPALYVHRLI